MRIAAAASDTAAPAVSSSAKASNKIPPEGVAVLRMLAQVQNARQDDIFEFDAAHACGLTPAICKYHAHKLYDAGLVHISQYGPGAHYNITPDGLGWLIDNKQMPD